MIGNPKTKMVTQKSLSTHTRHTCVQTLLSSFLFSLIKQRLKHVLKV